MGSELGKLLEARVLAPGTTGAGTVRAGQTLRIVDLEGQQVADFVAWKLGDPDEYQDIVYTNFVNRSWKMHAGRVLVSNHLHTLWTVTEDDCGEHYMGGGFCSRDLHVYDGHAPKDGCRDRLQREVTRHGMTPLHLREVSCFNVFMHVAYDPDGTWEIRTPKTKAADHIDLRAEMDVLWAVAVCDDPWSNGGRPTPMRFELYDSRV